MLIEIIYSTIVPYLVLITLIGSGLLKTARSKTKKKAQISSSWFAEQYTKYVYGYCKCCFERQVNALHTDSTLIIKGIDSPCINFGSYNYLGFGGGKCEEDFDKFFDSDLPLSGCCTRFDLPQNSKHLQLLEETESNFAQFIGTEAALIFPMGWGTNVTVIPILADTSTIIFSDQYNHASIAMGCRLVGGKCRVIPFKNNSPTDLECKIVDTLSKYIKNGKMELPFSKIIIIIEGLYSMEGNISQLRDFVRIKKTYNAYLYVDEAHSIGALGNTGRGICEYYSINPKDVDVLMGTFTKSFSSIGGYIAGSRELIEYVKYRSAGILNESCMAPACLKQINYVLSSDDFEKRVNVLNENTQYVRGRLLSKKRLKILGQDDSPVIPIVTYDIVSMVKISENFLRKHNIALVVAAYPATDMCGARVRLCISSSHTLEQLTKTCDLLCEL